MIAVIPVMPHSKKVAGMLMLPIMVISVAEGLSFSRAANRLGIAQPPLSQQIQRIEEILGFSLFERRPKVASSFIGAWIRTSSNGS